MAIKDALEFRKRLGEDEIIEYNSNVVYEGSLLAAKIWGTELMVKDRNLFKSLIMV
jgi:hypothetical protein